MWPFTGGCHYTLGCEKFYKECESCPSVKTLYLFNDKINSIF